MEEEDDEEDELSEDEALAFLFFFFFLSFFLPSLPAIELALCPGDAAVLVSPRSPRLLPDGLRLLLRDRFRDRPRAMMR